MAERNEKGQFVKGEYGGGPGRPKRSTEAEYLDALIEVTPLSAWKRIAKKAIQQAERGDSQARKWVSDYLLGPPIQKLQHTGADGGPIEFVVKYANGRNKPTEST